MTTTPPAEPVTTWIIGETSRAHWHVGVRVPYGYDPSRTYWATACTGAQIGGAFGPTTRTTAEPPSEIEHSHCPKCRKLYDAGRA